jgi:hypothetical protein
MLQWSTGRCQGITLIRVVESADITPEPHDDEREAILAALAVDAAARPSASDWAEAVLPGRDGEDDAP